MKNNILNTNQSSMLTVMSRLIIHLYKGSTVTVQSPCQLLVSPEGGGIGDCPLGGLPHPGVGVLHDLHDVVAQGRGEGDGVGQQLGWYRCHDHPGCVNLSCCLQ